MKFCTKCGKELADDEICSCESAGIAQETKEEAKEAEVNETGTNEAAPAPAVKTSTGNTSKVISDIINLLKGLIKKPADAVKTYVENAKIASPIVLIGATALINSICMIFYIIGQTVAESAKKNTIESIYSSIYGSTYAVVDKTASIISTLLKCCGAFFVGLISTIAVAALFALVIMVIINTLEKDNKVSYTKALTVASLLAVVTKPFELVGSLIAIIPFSFFDTLGGWFTSFGSAFSVYLVIVGIRSLIKDENHIPMAYALATVVTVIISSLLNLSLGI